MELDAERRWMEQAIRQAELAAEAGEVPVGAIIVKDGRMLSRGHNQVEQLRDATAHAEMLAITAAEEALDNWRLEGAEIYVTLEPCAMCAGAMVLSRVSRIIYGAKDPAAGACGSVFDIVSEPRLKHRIPVVRGVLDDRCGALLKNFFRSRRAEARSSES
ncbi:MAG TPA: tRNA adenosine(34) deaminase TadA [Planctomycetota bacterium]|jgi:tRNA(adenine34) deaminase